MRGFSVAFRVGWWMLAASGAISELRCLGCRRTVRNQRCMADETSGRPNVWNCSHRSAQTVVYDVGQLSSTHGEVHQIAKADNVAYVTPNLLVRSLIYPPPSCNTDIWKC